MNKADEMILLCSLYNKISETERLDLKILSKFKVALDKLVKNGDIREESAKNALYVLFENEKQKQLDEYVREHPIANNKVYSNETDSLEMDKLIESVLSEEITLPKPKKTASRSTSSRQTGDDSYEMDRRTTSEPDPCSRGGFYRSGC
jgi:hypothetical protein